MKSKLIKIGIYSCVLALFTVLAGDLLSKDSVTGNTHMLSLTRPAFAQSAEEEWSRTFGGSGADKAQSVQQTSDGGYIIAGYTESYGAGDSDFYLVKTDARGSEQWSRTFGGSSLDSATSVQQTSDSGYIIAGFTESYGSGSYDVYLVKTDSMGNEQWSRAFGGSDLDLATSIQQTSDGGYIIAGSTKSYGTGSVDVYLAKTDARGSEQWSRTFGGSSLDQAQSVQQTSDYGYIVVGYTVSYGAGNCDFYLVKTDARGNEQWSRTFGGSDPDLANSVQQTSDGGYIIAGFTASYGAGNSDFYLVKTDARGSEQWSRTFGGSGEDQAQSVQQTSDGGYIIAGLTLSYGAGKWDLYLVETNSMGSEQWSRTFGGSDSDSANSVQQTSDGGYIIAGYTASYGAGSSDIWLIKRRVTRENNPPVISNLSADAHEVTSGVSVTIRSVVSDAEGDSITYNWSCDDGTIRGTGTIVTWTAPGKEGSYNISLEVNDGRGGVQTGIISIRVLPEAILYVDLYGHRKDITVGEEIILYLSVVNPITSPGALAVQLTLRIPSGWSITSSGFGHGAGGLRTNTYEIEQGPNPRTIDVHILANEPYDGVVTGYMDYYFATEEDNYHKEVTLPVTAAIPEVPVEETPQSENGGGFFSCSAPAQGAPRPSSGELLLGWGPIGLVWGGLGGLYGILRWRRRK